MTGRGDRPSIGVAHGKTESIAIQSVPVISVEPVPGGEAELTDEVRKPFQRLPVHDDFRDGVPPFFEAQDHMRQTIVNAAVNFVNDMGIQGRAAFRIGKPGQGGSGDIIPRCGTERGIKDPSELGFRPGKARRRAAGNA